MNDHNRPAFTPHADYTVRKDFPFGGRRFRAGDPFPWRRLSCAPRRLRQLYEGRYLDMVSDSKARMRLVPAASSINQPVDPTRPWEGPLGEPLGVEPEIVKPDLEYDPGVHSIENPDRGIWLMMKGKKPVVRLTSKEAKRLRGRATPDTVNPNEILED